MYFSVSVVVAVLFNRTNVNSIQQFIYKYLALIVNRFVQIGGCNFVNYLVSGGNALHQGSGVVPLRKTFYFN